MKFKKLMSLILALAVAASCFCTGFVSASAQAVYNPLDKDVSDGIYPDVEGYNTVVFSVKVWEKAYIYAWQSQGEVNLSPWPGEAMKYALTNEYGESQYVAYIPAEYDMIVINNGDNTQQTVDLCVDSSCGFFLESNPNGDNVWTVGVWMPEFLKFGEETEPSTDADDDLFLYVEYDVVEDEDGNYSHHLFSAQASGGVAPYSYCFEFDGAILSDTSTNDEASVCVEKDGRYTLRVIATDSAGNINTLATTVIVEVYGEELPPVTEPAETHLLYFENVNQWDMVFAYAWSDNEDGVTEYLGQWPGVICENLPSGISSVEVPVDFEYIIFHDGEDNITNELVNPEGSNTAMFDYAESNNYFYSWYHPIPTYTTEPTEVTEQTIATEPAEVTEQTIATEPAEVTQQTIATEPTEVTQQTVAGESTEATETKATDARSEPSTSQEPTSATQGETASSTGATSPTEPEQGDVNGDGKLNIKDVTAIQKFLAKLFDFGEEIMLIADFNGDGTVNIKDATTIQKKLANLI